MDVTFENSNEQYSLYFDLNPPSPIQETRIADAAMLKNAVESFIIINFENVRMHEQNINTILVKILHVFNDIRPKILTLHCGDFDIGSGFYMNDFIMRKEL